MNAQRHLVRRNEDILQKLNDGVSVKALEEEYREKYKKTGQKEYKLKRWAFYQIQYRYGFKKMRTVTVERVKIGFSAPETNTQIPKTSSENQSLSNSVKINKLTVF